MRSTPATLERVPASGHSRRGAVKAAGDRKRAQDHGALHQHGALCRYTQRADGKGEGERDEKCVKALVKRGVACSPYEHVWWRGRPFWLGVVCAALFGPRRSRRWFRHCEHQLSGRGLPAIPSQLPPSRGFCVCRRPNHCLSPIIASLLIVATMRLLHVRTSVPAHEKGFPRLPSLPNVCVCVCVCVLCGGEPLCR